MKWSIALGILVGVVACGRNSIAAQQPASADASSSTKHELANTAYRLTVQIVDDQVHVTLDDKQSALRLAEGPYFFQSPASMPNCSIGRKRRGLFSRPEERYATSFWH